MPTFVTIGANGELTASSDFSFSPDCVEVDYDVARGWDGKLYKAGEEPTPPAPQPVDAPTVVITSDDIAIADAEWLVAAATAGDKTAEWLIAKLEL